MMNKENRKVITSAIVAAAAFIVIAASSKAVKAETVDAEYCEQIASLAETVMKARQAELDVVGMMKQAKGSKLFTILVKSAYKEPGYSTEEFKKNAISEFKAHWYLVCHDTIK